jgi:hypothetical protein
VVRFHPPLLFKKNKQAMYIEGLWEELLECEDLLPDSEVLAYLSDYFLDQGESEKAKCLLWCAKEKIRPFPIGGDKWVWSFGSKSDNWYNRKSPSTLPDELIELLKRHVRGEQSPISVGFKSGKDAWETLLDCWVKARESGWNPLPSVSGLNVKQQDDFT